MQRGNHARKEVQEVEAAQGKDASGHQGKHRGSSAAEFMEMRASESGTKERAGRKHRTRTRTPEEAAALIQSIQRGNAVRKEMQHDERVAGEDGGGHRHHKHRGSSTAEFMEDRASEGGTKERAGRKHRTRARTPEEAAALIQSVQRGNTVRKDVQEGESVEAGGGSHRHRKHRGSSTAEFMEDRASEGGTKERAGRKHRSRTPEEAAALIQSVQRGNAVRKEVQEAEGDSHHHRKHHGASSSNSDAGEPRTGHHHHHHGKEEDAEGAGRHHRSHSKGTDGEDGTGSAGSRHHHSKSADGEDHGGSDGSHHHHRNKEEHENGGAGHGHRHKHDREDDSDRHHHRDHHRTE